MSNPSVQDSSAAFAVGDLVNVESRTWPGINKPGGVGKVSRIHTDDSSYPIKVNVKYILGGEEKEIELQYVKKHEDLARGGRARQRREVMNLKDEGRARRLTGARTATKSDATKGGKKRGQNGKATATKKKKRKSDEPGSDASTKINHKDTASSPSSTDASIGRNESDLDSVVITDDEREDAAISQKRIATKKEQKKSPVKTTSNTKEMKARRKQAKSQDKDVTVSKGNSKESEKGKTEKDASEKKAERKSLREVGNKKERPKEATVLQKVHAVNSRTASTFVCDVVGKAPVPSSLSYKKTQFADNHDQDSTSGGESDDETLIIDVERRQLFVSSLNDIMTKRMVDEMGINEILIEVNTSLVDGLPASPEGGSLFQAKGKGGTTAKLKPFTNLEIRSYLNELDRENKIMQVDGTVYRI